MSIIRSQQIFGNIKIFLFDTYNYLRDIILYYLHKNKRKRIDRFNKDILIFGNGPSLKEIVESNLDFSNFEIFVCNGFANTSYFEKIKPKYYFLKDNLYFDLNNSFVIEKKNNVLATWDSIFAKTKWKMTIYTALYDTKLIENLKKRYNNNENIIWNNIYPLEFRSFLKYKFLKKGIGIIGGMTVTHFSLFIAILKAKKNIYLLGVDHDWISNIKYDTSNHKLYLNDNHFYDTEKIYYGEGIYKSNDIVLELYSQFKSFEGFKDLQTFSKFNNVNLYRSTKSFLHFIEYFKLN